MNGVDDDEGGQGGPWIAEKAARIGDAPIGEIIAEQAVIRGEQGAEDEADDDRRDRGRDQQQRETDPLEQAVAPQKKREREAGQEFHRDGGDGELHRRHDRAARRIVRP